MSESTNKELLDALGVEVTVETRSTLTPKQERIIAGFEDINRFFEEYGHAPCMERIKIFSNVFMRCA